MKSNTITGVLITIGFTGDVFVGTIIHAGRLVNGHDAKVHMEMTVRVDQDRIVAVESGYGKPEPEDDVINLSNRTLMPGWMDMHTHLMSQAWITRTSRG